jgi:DnaJ-domain-containing protein 1
VRWLGKLVGAVLGWVLLRHPLGVLLGAALGHAFDAGWLALRGARPAPEPPRAPTPPPGDDPYAVLGVAADASQAEIDRAYRQLMGRHHPDRVAGEAEEIRVRAEARARAINAAYDRIRERRRKR